MNELHRTLLAAVIEDTRGETIAAVVGLVLWAATTNVSPTTPFTSPTAPTSGPPTDPTHSSSEQDDR
ncbi:hypothetical protein IU450_27695 [Nocardia abscessus]|uniref:hypothetical protein n=1 Tax=Nocardia abscessus TaxID=120957 RepID=UPI0018957E8F|nr:hypothetical protein [Nocardia abscessus]MBF6339652.1 hypothetical protein [Nocardia abscessus]